MNDVSRSLPLVTGRCVPAIIDRLARKGDGVSLREGTAVGAVVAVKRVRAGSPAVKPENEACQRRRDVGQATDQRGDRESRAQSRRVRPSTCWRRE